MTIMTIIGRLQYDYTTITVRLYDDYSTSRYLKFFEFFMSWMVFAGDSPELAVTPLVSREPRNLV